MLSLEDGDKMPMGKHKGDQMADVPAGWLKWFYEANIGRVLYGRDNHAVMNYIKKYKDAINEELTDKIL